MTLKRQEKIGNIFFLKQDTFFYTKMYVWHFYQKIPTGLHSGLHYYSSLVLQLSFNPLYTLMDLSFLFYATNFG